MQRRVTQFPLQSLAEPHPTTIPSHRTLTPYNSLLQIYGELVQRWRLSTGAKLLKWPREQMEVGTNEAHGSDAFGLGRGRSELGLSCCSGRSSSWRWGVGEVGIGRGAVPRRKGGNGGAAWAG